MPTIAIVNNERNIRTSFRMYFEAEGFTVVEYPDTESALELCDNPVDIALLDKTNPPLGGIELFKRIRKRHGMPIIFLSAWETEVREELEKTARRADGYIDIPCSQRDVLKHITAVLQSREHRF